MPAQNASAKPIESQFVRLASRISEQFPQLDLRFNLQSGTKVLRCLIAENSPSSIIEVALGSAPTEELLYEAIFAIKVATHSFDA